MEVLRLEVQKYLSMTDQGEGSDEVEAESLIAVPSKKLCTSRHETCQV